MVNRRDFIRGAAYVGSYLALGAAVPKLIGEQAGGFYAPIPNDLSLYLHQYDPIRIATSADAIQSHAVYALWAPLGATHAAIAMFAGMLLIKPSATPEIVAAQSVNAEQSMRGCLARHHEPGWFKVRVFRELDTFDANGDPVTASEEAWKRVGYVKWLKVAELATLGRDIMVPA